MLDDKHSLQTYLQKWEKRKQSFQGMPGEQRELYRLRRKTKDSEIFIL